MNIGNSQEQHSEGGSTAIQAGRDVNYYGMSVSEVKELCRDFLRDNFPKLREEALKLAMQHVVEFSEILKNNLDKDIDSIIIEKLADPDVQATINDAVQAAARKGLDANLDILSTLITSRISKNSNSFKDIVISEAVKVVPKLTKSHIALLSFIHLLISVKIEALESLNKLEPIGANLLSYATEFDNISDINVLHIEYSGAVSLNQFTADEAETTEHIYNTYKHLGHNSIQSFTEALIREAPSYFSAINKYDQLDLSRVILTSVGEAIAIANLSASSSITLDYSEWLA